MSKALTLMIVYAILITILIVLYVKQQYVDFYVTGLAVTILTAGLIGFRVELRRRLQLKAGMIFMDGGVPCEITRYGTGLMYRSYILSFAARDMKEGVVIYSSYNTVKNGDSAYGIVAYNPLYNVMMTPESKKVERIDNIKRQRYVHQGSNKNQTNKNAILRRKK
jgi:hypothetical protein